ncbi:polysaccharide biosynthesis/export family protein [Paludibacterium purpuratum]|uniref:Polysaccharide export outer membrane protein n=1 Tax=Paludibacterium purpuratum TaxID=1144873 RepID=A0A4R7B263_9NEIS|nr:polysaccharide biosynthesis/export family protein [Paludibacterium purpuratum]TDR77822.1 polysaccharide export outer membrane protein [Paludibacterium purpuratum]
MTKTRRFLIFVRRGLLPALFCVLCLAGWAGNAGEYRLGPGDIVKVSVYNSPDLTVEAMLSSRGDLNFPLLGRLHLADLSGDEAERLIAERLAEGGYVGRPQVTLVVSQFRSRQISVIGEFNHPGSVVLDRPTDLLSVIAQVGGIGPSGGDTVVVIHDQQRQVLSLSQLVAEPVQALRTILLSSGDVVYAPRALVFVSGEVNRPGAYRREAKMTVQQAIAVAGGLTAKAAPRALTIHRVDPGGQTRAQEASASDPLQEGDVVDVGESWF